MSGQEFATAVADAHDRMERYLTTAEVAAWLRTSPETVRYWRHIGTGPASFKVGRRVLYAREDVERFIAEARASTGPTEAA
jgi:excisionase family DNA binding protein